MARGTAASNNSDAPTNTSAVLTARPGPMRSGTLAPATRPMRQTAL